MTESQFIEIINTFSFIDSGQLKSLIDGVGHLAEQERSDLIEFLKRSNKQINEYDEQIKQEEKQYVAHLEEFLKEDIPKMLKNYENQERESEMNEANDLVEEVSENKF